MKLETACQYTIEYKDRHLHTLTRIQILELTEKTIIYNDVDLNDADIERVLITDFIANYNVIEDDDVDYVDSIELDDYKNN